jgi:hypothetical protein
MPVAIDESTGVLQITPEDTLRQCSCPSDCSSPVEIQCPLIVTDYPQTINAVFDGLLDCSDDELIDSPVQGHLFCLEPGPSATWTVDETVGGILWRVVYTPWLTLGNRSILILQRFVGGFFESGFFNDNLPGCILGLTEYDNEILIGSCGGNNTFYGGIGMVFTDCSAHLASISSGADVCSPPTGGTEITYTVTIENFEGSPQKGALVDWTLNFGGGEIDSGTDATDGSGEIEIVSDCLCENGVLRLVIENIYGPVVWSPEDDEVSTIYDVDLVCI